MERHLSQYMHCLTSSSGSVAIRRGTFSLVASVDGSAPRRQATIEDGWGDLRCVTERENDHWRLVVEGDASSFADFVPV
jgi:hypothetical protein